VFIIHVIGKIARNAYMPSDHSKVTKMFNGTEQFTKWNYNHAKCNCNASQIKKTLLLAQKKHAKEFMTSTSTKPIQNGFLT